MIANQRISDFFSGICPIPKEALILVGVSGGADSLFLLHALHEAGHHVMAATFHHQLRPEADSEVDFVRSFCAQRTIPFHTETGDVRQMAEENGQSLEEAARYARYAFLFSCAEKQHACAVAVGHHEDDQAETVLLRLIQGAGLEGLSGMKPVTYLLQFSANIPLIRPLLWWSRAEIESAVMELGLHPVEDSSNQDEIYLRNRIRHQLIPLLKKSFNPSITKTLARNALLMQKEAEALQWAVDRAIPEQIVSVSEHQAVFSLPDWGALPEAVQGRFFRAAVEKIAPDSLREWGVETIQRALLFLCDAKRGKRLTLPQGLVLRREGQQAFLSRNGLQHPMEQHFLQLPHCRLEMEEEMYTPKKAEQWIAEMKKDRFFLCLDAEAICEPVCLRTFQPGERIQPFGMNGQSQKISDLMINRKVPQELRAAYPVVADQQAVLWVPPFVSAESARIHDGTKRVLLFHLILKRHTHD